MEKKIPMRSCVCCRTVKEKNQLLRIVKNGEQISVDKTGKMNGRGAYICGDKECLKKLKKAKVLNKVFSCEVPETVYNEIEEYIFGNEK